MHEKIEQHFSILFITAILIGIFLPSIGILFEPFILYFLVAILFLSCLKINTKEAIIHIKKPRRIAYITFMLLIAIPIALYLITKQIYPEIALPVLILTAMPAAMASSALTDISKGNISLALIITTITTLLCPFTIPLLLKYIVKTEITISTISMLLMLSKIIFIPFILAIIIKKTAKKQVENTKKYYSSMSILFLMPLIMGPLAKHSASYLTNINQVINMALYLFVISIILHIIGWLMIYKSDKKDKIATSITSAYMNNGLAIVFTAQFFDPVVLLAVLLYQLPWDLMLVPFKYVLKRMK